MKTLIISIGLIGLLLSVEKTDFKNFPNSMDTIPLKNLKKKKPQISIYTGLVKNYATLIICECKEKTTETELIIRNKLESKGVRVITQAEYQQKHKEASEVVLKQTLSGGSTSSSEELQEKLKNYPHNIQVLAVFTDFSELSPYKLSALHWKIRHEPLRGYPVKRSMPDSLILSQGYSGALQMLCDSLVWYSK